MFDIKIKIDYFFEALLRSAVSASFFSNFSLAEKDWEWIRAFFQKKYKVNEYLIFYSAIQNRFSYGERKRFIGGSAKQKGREIYACALETGSKMKRLIFVQHVFTGHGNARVRLDAG